MNDKVYQSDGQWRCKSEDSATVSIMDVTYTRSVVAITPLTRDVSMALQVRVATSKVALQNLLVCVILFYTVYYLSLSICCLTLKGWELDVMAPFDFKTRPSWLNTNYKVLLVSTEVTYFVCGLLFALIVQEWVWDYAISVTILHVLIASAVMLEFPLTSHWWAALVSGLISMICGGQILAYCLFKDNFISPDLDNF